MLFIQVFLFALKSHLIQIYAIFFNLNDDFIKKNEK